MGKKGRSGPKDPLFFYLSMRGRIREMKRAVKMVSLFMRGLF